LVGAWDFEGTGNVAEDSSGNGHPMELAGQATQDADAGVHGGALVLRGRDNASVPSLDAGAFPRTGTMTLWLRYAAETPAGFGVFDNFDTTRSHLFLRQRPNTQGTVQVAFQLSPDTGDYAWENTFSTTPATWIHIAVAWDEPGKRAALWLNGHSLHDAAFAAGFTFGEQRFLLGDNLTGAIDEVRLYRVVLSDAEIKAIAK
jgi:hypothetical protein